MTTKSWAASLAAVLAAGGLINAGLTHEIPQAAKELGAIAAVLTVGGVMIHFRIGPLDAIVRTTMWLQAIGLGVWREAGEAWDRGVRRHGARMREVRERHGIESGLLMQKLEEER